MPRRRPHQRGGKFRPDHRARTGAPATTPVGNTVQAVWDVRAAVGDEVQAIWNVLSTALVFHNLVIDDLDIRVPAVAGLTVQVPAVAGLIVQVPLIDNLVVR